MRMSNFETENFRQCLRALIQAEGNGQPAFEFLRRQNPILVKSAVGASGSGDLAGDFDTLAGGQFFLSLEHGPRGVFDTIKEAARRARFNTRMFLSDGGIVGSIVVEGTAIPVCRGSFAVAELPPSKATSITVTTKEFAAMPEGIASLELDLKQDNMRVIDAECLRLVAVDAGATEEATANSAADLAKLLAAVNLSGFGELFWVFPMAVQNYLLSLQALGGFAVYPDLTPKGGSLWGIQAIPTAAISDEIFLIDASGLCVGAEDLSLRITTQAMLEMEDDPAMDAGTPTAPSGRLVSLFQTDSIGILAIRSFAVKVVRPTAVAVLTGVLEAWGVGGESS